MLNLPASVRCTLLGPSTRTALYLGIKSGLCEPTKGSVIAPNTDFKFQYHSIADYGVSSYNFTCWLFTSPPRFFEPSETFAMGYHLANKYPHNPPPATFKMPDFSKLGPGWGVGSNASHAKIYFAVIEEYGDGQPSLGYRMSLSFNEITYNGTGTGH
ncbi:hypothetical protein B0H13DRAFT_1968911 [Mycena leptocephala]|nr:hypothetical protein B0H13DRAFT_1968911 [Mycena leptocephala]